MTVAYSSIYGNADVIAPQSASGGNLLQVLFKELNITTAFAATDTIDIGYLPKGAIPVGGYLATEAGMETGAGSATLDLDVGITDNGTDGAAASFFTDGGVENSAAVTNVWTLTNAANVRLFVGPFSVRQLSAKTKVQLKCIAAANAGGTGKIVVCVTYFTPGSPTS